MYFRPSIHSFIFFRFCTETCWNLPKKNNSELFKLLLLYKAVKNRLKNVIVKSGNCGLYVFNFGTKIVERPCEKKRASEFCFGSKLPPQAMLHVFFQNEQ